MRGVRCCRCSRLFSGKCSQLTCSDQTLHFMYLSFCCFLHTQAQFARLAGCTVVGIAGGESKCSYLVDTLKLDAAIDYKKFSTDEALQAELLRVTGGRNVDVYFDNVGGTISDAVTAQMNLRGRIIICGQISQYDTGLEGVPNLGPRQMHLVLYKRITIQGVLARDYTHRMAEMLEVVVPWLQRGAIQHSETILEGFERLPEALSLLFEGGNLGKMLVKVD
jgi:NADPH-dependent curcumin reductase CurA